MSGLTQRFSFTIGNAVEVRQRKEDQLYEATVGDDVSETGATEKEAANKAMAAYVRGCADRVEKTGRL